MGFIWMLDLDLDLDVRVGVGVGVLVFGGKSERGEARRGEMRGHTEALPKMSNADLVTQRRLAGRGKRADAGGGCEGV